MACFAVALVAITAVAAQTGTVNPALDPLTDISAWAPWITNLTTWGVTTAASMGYAPTDANSAYVNPQLTWVASAVLHVDVMLTDRRLGPPTTEGGNFSSIPAYVADIEGAFGRIDAVTLWPALPLVGIDARDQWDWLNGIGSASVTKATTAFRGLGVRTLLGVVGWDSGTTPSASAGAPAAVLGALGFDGAAGLDVSYFDPSWDVENGTSFALCGDGPLPNGPPPTPPTLAPLARTPCSRYSALGSVTSTVSGTPALRPSTFRWLEPRHAAAAPLAMLGGGSTRRRDAILAAFLGGAGFSVTDNNFGVLFDGASARDSELVRRTSTLLRFIQPLMRPGPLQQQASRSGLGIDDPPLPDGIPPNARWLPQLPVTSSSNAVVASQFFAACPKDGPLLDGGQYAWRGSSLSTRHGSILPQDAGLSWGTPGEDNCTVYVLANFGTTATVASLNVSLAYQHANASVSVITFIDLYRGAILFNASSSAGMNASALTQLLLPGDVAAVLVTPHASPLPQALRDFLAFAAANLSRVNITDYSDAWSAALQQVSPFTPSVPATSPPVGSVLLPGVTGFRFVVNSSVPQPVARGGSLLVGADTQYSWESAPTSVHSTTLDIPPFYMGVAPVTNDAFQMFLWSSGYVPTDTTNYLRHWVILPNGSMAVNVSSGDGPRPVVWVSHTDAATYCAAASARLPLEWEWAYAAQAGSGGVPDGRMFPWGNVTCEAAPTPGPCPATDTSRSPRPPDVVGSHAAGNSPLGITDLVGLVWQHTYSTYCDVATCAAILRGGTYYAPVDAGGRYPPRLLDNYHHMRMPYGSDAGTRAGTIGFRCVIDVPTAAA